MIYPLTKEHLTKDDIKVVKHLNAINNLFKKGDLTVSSLFADTGSLKLLKTIDGIDYEVESYCHIICDGGDPDSSGFFGIHSQEELENLYEEENV